MLKASGRLVKVEPHQHAVRRCYRCDTVVEPRLSDQWFVKMKPLAEPALAAVRDGRIRIVPERWEGVYVHWLDTIRDWNISRQLWWGHRIPVWYCDGCGRETVSRDDVLDLPVVFGACAPGRRCARHVVLVMAVALLHAGMAEGHARPSGVLPDRRARERTRHPVLLGRADDHVGLRVHGRGAVSHRVPARHRPRHEAPQDVQVVRQRDRPARRDRAVRRRSAALHGGGRDGARRGHHLRPRRSREVVRAGPELRHETLEHRAVPPHERRDRARAGRVRDRPATASRAPTSGSSRASTPPSPNATRRSVPRVR